MVSEVFSDFNDSMISAQFVMQTSADGQSLNRVYVMEPSAELLCESQVWGHGVEFQPVSADCRILSSGGCTSNQSSECSLCRSSGSHFSIYRVVKGDFWYNLTALIFVLSSVNILSFPEVNITQSGIIVSFLFLLSCFP